jgi:endonuclease/exonuclease/phosphatase family metal-dependent hydrolase
MRLLHLSLLALIFLSSSPAAEALRIMSFNVRYPAKSDGPNIWDARRDILIATIRDKQPDLIGTQELFHLQGEYIVEKLPGYAWFGVGRRGDQTDEHMGVFYRKDRFELKDSGNFWLSETPETPGSSSWDMSLPRLVTWGEFNDKKSGRSFRFYNTHFPHRREDEAARTQCARVIAERLRALPKDLTVIVTGDFNTDAGSEAHRTLTANLTDAYSSVSNPSGPKDTFHGFRGTPRPGRIDWILFRGGLTPRSFETVTNNENGSYPSDHFPVAAVLEWK